MKYIKIGIFFSVLILSLLPLQVYAEDEPIDEPIIEEEVEQSPIAKFYEESVRPHLITLLSSYLGSNVGIGVILALTFKNTKKKIDKAIDKMNITQEEKEKLQSLNNAMLDTMQKIVTNKLEPYMEKVDELAEISLKILEENKTLQDTVIALTEQVSIKNEQILKILEIAFTNNPDLVRNGFATAIKKELAL